MRFAITYNRIYWKVGRNTRHINISWYRDIPILFKRIFYKTIYYTCWSRDCDMCESTTAGLVYGEKAWDIMMDGVSEWAEGPVSYDRISKEEYKEFIAPPVRDRVLEAYENGRGNSIYV